MNGWVHSLWGTKPCLAEHGKLCSLDQNRKRRTLKIAAKDCGNRRAVGDIDSVFNRTTASGRCVPRRHETKVGGCEGEVDLRTSSEI